MGTVQSSKNKRYSSKPDKNTHEDKTVCFNVIENVIRNIMVVDMIKYFPKITDQMKTNASAVYAFTSLYEYMYQILGEPHIKFSEHFLYWNDRETRQEVNKDNGSSIKDLIQCADRMVPIEYHSNENIFSNPSDEAYLRAKKYMHINCFKVKRDIDQIKQSLIRGYPIIMNMLVYNSFELKETIESGIILMPIADDQIIGCTTVIICGFDDTVSRFILRLSFGIEFGDNGYGYLPYDYIISRSLDEDIPYMVNNLWIMIPKKI